MNYRSIAHVMGTLLLVTAGAMILPILCSLSYGSEGDLPALLISAAITAGIGLPVWWSFRRHQELDIREAFAIAFFGWILISAVSALPFVIHGAIPSFTDAFFEMMSGYTTTDYEKWPQAAQMFLYAVCFVGACAGSTTSGIKIVHYVIIIKFMVVAIKKIFLQPLAVDSVRINGLPMDQSVINLALCYFIVNIFLVLGGGCVMVLTDDMDFVTAMSSVIATLMNIGPGFGGVGPSKNYAHISDAGKWFLSWLMLVGRLEMFSALVIFYPSFWRR